MAETDYEKLLPLLMPEVELRYYDFPCNDPTNPGCILVPRDKELISRFLEILGIRCINCQKSYEVDQEGMPTKLDWCFYHERGFSETTKLYPCCDKEKGSEPCKGNTWHVNNTMLYRANIEGFEETQLKEDREPSNHGVFGVCTKSCYTPNGLELTRAIVVDHNLKIIYNKLVKPSKPILNYDTPTSGIRKSDMDKVTTCLSDVQKDLLEMFSSKSILIGQYLNISLKLLKLVHRNVVETSVLYLVPGGPYTRMTLFGCLEHQKQADKYDKKEIAARLALRVAYNEAGVDTPSGW